MSFSCGFYDAIDNDRTYSATQFGEMFDGLITDGIYATIGEAFAVVPGSGVGVKVKSGRAWFNKTWSVNTSDLPLTLEDPDLLLSRIDAIILEIDTRVITRNNSIKVITGSPGIDPEKPVLVRGDGLYQYPLAWVTVDKNVSVIAASKIENNIGITPTPFVTGILKSITIDELWTQWEGQFDEWFANIKNQLEGNVALNLQRQIDALNDSKVNMSDKATSEEISAGANDKWVDANGLASYVDGVIKPIPGESTIIKTKYPMIGQELSVTEHPELFAKIGYKYGLCDIDRIYIYPATSREYLQPIQHASMPQLGNRLYGYSLANGGNLSSRKYPSRILHFSSTNFSNQFIQQSNRSLIALLGETETHGLTIESGGEYRPTSLKLNLYKFPTSGTILNDPSSTVINVSSTVMNRLNLNLSPCIRGTVIKWPYLYTLNNLIYMGVVTISSYTTSPSFTTATVQIPTTSDTVNWTDDSLEIGINRSIILDGKVYIHVVNKTGVTVIYVYDLFTSSWVSISSATKNLIADWTEKYSNFDYSNTAYDSFSCMKLGSVKAKLDGSLIEYGLIYVDPETKEIKTYEDTTCVMGNHMHAVLDKSEEYWYTVFSTDFVSSNAYIDRNVRYPKWEPRKYKTYFQFYKGKAAIIVLSIGKVSLDLFLGMSYFDPTDKLVPIQLYSDLAPLTGYEGSFGIRQPLYQLKYTQYGTLDEIIDNTLTLQRKSIRSTCRFGNLNSLSIPIFANIGCENGSDVTSSQTMMLEFSQTNFILSLKKPTASDICTDKFRLPDAHGAPLYLSV